MPADIAAITDWVNAQIAKPTYAPEVLKEYPDLTPAEAYQVQIERMRRCVKAGDRIIGYKAALTNKKMQERYGVGEPVLGTMLASRQYPDYAPVSTATHIQTTLEPEVAVLIGSRLKGPGLTAESVLPAIAGYMPCVEIGDLRTKGERSLQQTICCNTYNGGHVFGGALVRPEGIDLALEGMVLRINGEIRSTGTGANVLDNPLNAVAFMANKLGDLDLALEPGMMLMTGSIVMSEEMHPGDDVQVSFTRLGTVNTRFTA